MSGMTLSPSAGKYLVTFSTVISQDTVGASVFVSIYKGGSQVSGSERVIQPRNSTGNSTLNTIPVAVNAIVTVTNGQSIDIYWRTSGGTATAKARIIDIIKIA
jgi:hypothetical protein